MSADREVDVPDPDHPRVVVDGSFGGEPRVRGRRITVLDVYDGVREGGGEMTPAEFADTFELDVADVYAALAYYHAHPDEMERHRDAREGASSELRERVERSRPAGLGPDD